MQFDVETTGVQWYANEMFMAQFGNDRNADDDTFSRMHEPGAREHIQQMLDYDEGYYAWNSKFDLHFLDQQGFRLPDPAKWHDVMVMAHVLNENRSLALKSVSASMFGESARDHEKAVKEWLAGERKRRRDESKETGAEFVYPHYGDVPPGIMDPYAIEDIVLTRAVAERYEKMLRDAPDLHRVYLMEMEVMAALYDMEKRGFPVEQELAYKFEAELADALDIIEARCIDLAGVPHFNPNSPKQIIEALERRGADLTYAVKTKTGYSTNEESLEAIDDDLSDAILEFRAQYKTLGTYVKPMLHPHFDKKLHQIKQPFVCSDGRVRPNYRQVGARTGRMSCADPNVQNWPRDDLRLRYLMAAGDGQKLVTCDLDNIELHLFAAFAGDGPLLDAISEGRDSHSMTASSLGLAERKRATGVESARDRGKRFNYSVIYGAGIRSIRRTFRVSQAEARQLLDRYHNAYPEVGRLQRQIEARLRDRGYVTTFTGRRMRVKPRDAYKATNYLIQGTAAEMLKLAIIELHKQGVPLIAPVHDELIALVDEKDAPEVAHMMQEALTNFDHIKAKVPVTAEAQIVDRWSQAKKPDYVPSYAQSKAATIGG